MADHGCADYDWADQVCYQVFVRSFFDGNGDHVGDFRGLEGKLDVLGELGVTVLWLNPIHPSPSHHNYFTADFFATDPEYGSLEDFASLCRAVHARGMRILIDMETQYLLRSHPWVQEVLADPSSPYRQRFLFREDDGGEPVHLSLRMGDGGKTHLFEVPDAVTLNLHDAGIAAWQRRIFSHWLDPLGNGDRDSGVDGFRLDHVMDDLDELGMLTGLFETFWRPLLDHLRGLDPSLFFLAEPADWKSTGRGLFEDARMDGVFAMPLMFALRSLDAPRITKAVSASLAAVPAGKQAFVTLENHDVSRYASVVGEDPARERLAAALLLTLPGVPTLYYGQELGMTGDIELALRRTVAGVHGDASAVPEPLMEELKLDYHLPVREACRWSRDIQAPGMATWYRDRPFWPHNALARDDGRTYEDQHGDSDSLLNWYRRLIALRRQSVALRRGDFVGVLSDDRDVLAFLRRHDSQTVLVAANLGTSVADIRLDPEAAIPRSAASGASLHPGEDWGGRRTMLLQPLEVRIVELRGQGAA